MVKKEKRKVSRKFVIALSIVSIMGFIGIISQSLFNNDIGPYIEALWLLTIGGGLMWEANVEELKKSIKRKGLDANNFTKLTTAIIGALAIFAGLFSFPFVKITNPSFHAIKGIVSMIAIAVIVIETWLIE